MEGSKIFSRYKRPSSNAMEVVVQKDGRSITFIEATFQNFGSPTEMGLEYDLGKCIITISSANEQTRDPIPVRKEGNRYRIPARAFFNEHGIKISEARNYKLTFNDGFATINPYGPFTYAFAVPRGSLKSSGDEFMKIAEKAMQEAKKRGTTAIKAIESVIRVFFKEKGNQS